MANKTFSNWLASLAQATVVPGDLIPVVQGGVSKRASAGQANGLATLNGSGVLAQAGFVHAVGQGASLQSTTADYNSGPIAAQVTAPISGHYLAFAVGKLSPAASPPFAAGLVLVKSTDGGTTWVAVTPRSGDIYLANGADEGTQTSIASGYIAAGDILGIRFGVKPNMADGTRSVNIWGPAIIAIFTGEGG